MHQNRRLQSVIIGISLLLLAVLYGTLSRSANLAPNLTTQPKISLARSYGRLPMHFEPLGSVGKGKDRFAARGLGYSLTLTATEALMHLTRSRKEQKANTAGPSAVVRMKLLAANPAPRVEALAKLPGTVNYMIGNNPERWRRGVPTFAKVKQHDVYPGIDLVWYGNQQQLEYDFVVAPGANPNQIAMIFADVGGVELDKEGDLILQTGQGPLRQRKPTVYQESHGQRRSIEGSYSIRNREVSFQIGNYDPSLPLVIDPILVYSTFLGGSSENDTGTDIAVDSAGNAYVTGFTNAPDFPTEKALQKDFKSRGDCAELCPDAFVVKLNPAGSSFVYATYFGGDGSDTGSGIAVDAAGNAYVTGTTGSTNFPTVRPFQNSLKGFDAFVAKLSPDGSSLVYSTYFGGSVFESGTGIAVDATGNAYITGTTIGSPDLPIVNGFQRAPGGGSCVVGETIPCPDAYIAKFNPAGSALVYSTYLGGGRFDSGAGIAVDGLGQAVVAGSTSSANFPMRNAVQQSFAGGSCESADLCFDTFVTKLTADGSGLIFSTYLGGQSSENPIDVSNGVAADAAGNSYVTGTTLSEDFPLKTPLRGGVSIVDSYVTKFDPMGAIIYSTYLGGRDLENASNLQFSILSIIGQAYSSNSIAVDSSGNAYVVGTTNSDDFPTLNSAQPRLGGGTCEGDACPDVFVTKISPAGTLISSTFLGGNNLESGLGVAVDGLGNVFVTGLTASANFPIANPKQGAIKGAADLFVAKIGEAGMPTAVTSVSAASFVGPQLAPESIVSAFGTNLATATEVATTIPLPTTLAGTTVTIRDINGTERLAPLFFVAPTQVNYQITPGTPPGSVTISIANFNGQVTRGSAQIVSAMPGLFSANSSGQGVAAAVVLRVRDGQQYYEPAAILDPVTRQFIPVPIDLGPETDQLFLIAFGTGIRFRLNASATIGGAGSELLFIGPSTFIGVDQVNMRIPRSLAGRGEVDVVLMADGRMSNVVKVSFR